MWGPGYSLSDINAVAVSPMRDCLVSGEDDGCLRVFRYPAVGSDVKSVVYAGHSSAIKGLAFSEDQRYIMSVGGYDVCLLHLHHGELRVNLEWVNLIPHIKLNGWTNMILSSK